MEGKKEAATATATATQENSAKLVNFEGKNKFQFTNILDKIMQLGFDDVSSSFTEKMKRNIRVNEEIAQAHTIIPINCLPDNVQSIVRQFAAEQETCTNYVATNLLVAAGVAVGTNLEIDDGDWKNYPNLYACLVGNPSAGKSPSMRSILRPLNEKDKNDYNSYRANFAEWKKAKEPSTPMPQCLQIIVKDSTPEAIIDVLSKNRRGILIHADEATRFFRNVDKYSGGDFISQMSESWSGDPIRVNRKTQDIPILIENPFLSLICGIQPSKICEIFKPYIDGGFPQRFLFVFANSSEIRIIQNQEIHDKWSNIIYKLLRTPVTTLKFTSEASDLLNSFNSLVRELGKDCEDKGNNVFAEWLLKQNYVVRRVAGILHLLDENSDSELINIDGVRKATRLTISFGYHFLRALGMLEVKPKMKMSKREALRFVVEEYKLFENTEKRKAFTPNSLAKILGISQSTLWEHLNK